MKTYHLSLLPGDGIGIEVMEEAKKLLIALQDIHGGISWHLSEYDWGCEYYATHAKMLPDDGIDRLSGCDAILLGAVGYPGVPDHVSLRGLLLPIRQQFEQYVNLRPIKLMKGMNTPLKTDLIDFVVIRENSEGEYCGIGRIENEGNPNETAIQEAHFSRRGTSRILNYAFEHASKQGAKSVISATKSNALNYSMVYWDQLFDDIRQNYQNIHSWSMHVDALAGYFIMKPEKIDVVVASNLFGDILTDLGSAMLGSIGISPSANINPERNYPSMFEPIHGSAPDIAGKGIANPIGMIWSIAMMLDHLGLPELSKLTMDALEKTIAAPHSRTPDMGGDATTEGVTQAIISNLEKVV